MSGGGPAGAPLLQVRGLRKAFDGVDVLRDLSFTIDEGQIVSLVGPSGSGKSTLLNLLTGALAADGGRVLYRGAPVPAGRRPFAYMPQRDVLLPWRRVLDNAAIGLEVAGVSRADARQHVRDLLPRFGLARTEGLYPAQLSGGMRQRVAFLRTVIQDRPILLLDEPFGALDAITREELHEWLLEVWAAHRWTILLITHDIREAVRLSDRVLVLSGQTGSLLPAVEVPRSVPRGEGFLTAPEVPHLEERLHEVLTEAARLRP